ncbi:hypothetical protein K8I85_11605, partial [bacterium]|nr:hypothetical protein [bacterium]
SLNIEARWIRRLAVFVAWCLGSLAVSAEATPRLAMRLGQDCLLCHQNPSGGGMRSEYASQYLLPERLAMRGGTDEAAAEEAPFTNPRIADNVVLGLDLRTAYLQRDDRDAGNNFLPMQGALHLAVELEARASIHVREEMAQGAARAVELYGLAFVLPASGYVKVGRFVPAFGWKQDDHRAFTRREFVFLPAFPPQSDTGVEIGFRPGPWSIQLSATNGEFASAREQNDELAFTGRASWRRDFPGGHAAIGASYTQHRGIRRAESGATGEDVYAGGPFAGLRVGRLTWLGEFDWTHRETGGGADGPAKFLTFTTSQELSWEVVQGIDAVALYDFHDVDVDHESGAVTRCGGAVDARLRAWVGVHAGVNRFTVEDGPDLVARAGGVAEATESIVMIHFLY